MQPDIVPQEKNGCNTYSTYNTYRKKNQGVNLSKEQRFQIYLNSNKRCYYCGVGIVYSSMTLDHIVPKSKLPKNEFQLERIRRFNEFFDEGLVISCVGCNSLKGNTTLEEFKKCEPPKFTNEQEAYLRLCGVYELVMKQQDFTFYGD